MRSFLLDMEPVSGQNTHNQSAAGQIHDPMMALISSETEEMIVHRVNEGEEDSGDEFRLD